MNTGFSLDQLSRDALNLPHCWVCDQRFKDSQPPGPKNREVHHICPRNAGGTDGPVVSLCDSHHTLIHKIAERFHRSARADDLFVGEEPRYARKLIWLALMVVRSEQNVQDDPDKTLVGSFSFTKTELAMLKRLQSTTGKGRSELIRTGLFLLYRQYFK